MKIILLADNEQKVELIPHQQEIGAELIWSDDLGSLQNYSGADACIDLLFDDTVARIKQLRQLQSPVIIVSSVIMRSAELGTGIIRINGWNTFLKRQIIEAAADEELRKKASTVFLSINKKVEWVPDITGFISSRVVASIINEAYFALDEEVSSKEQIDTAMKLGTNYPYGPFEWGEKIGLQRIHKLLNSLSSAEKRFNPAPSLTKEAKI